MSRRLPLPDVVIGGAPRSGTTFLTEVLGKHPSVFLARPIAPEPKVCLREHPDGEAGFLAEYAHFFKDASEQLVRIEKTTNYFENDAARERLARVLPDARFLFILREPVSRAYSNWKWSCLNGLERLAFSEAIALEGQRPNPFGKERESARPFDYMSRGHYGTLAAAWYGAFGRDRIHFVLFEDYVRDPEAAVLSLQNWIGIEPMPWRDLRVGKVNATPEDVSGLDPEIEAQLRSQIRPEIEKFKQLSGIDLTAWGYS
jgi:Sulfotransferase family